MKKILFIVFVLFVASCSTTYTIEPMTEQESKGSTTITLQELPKDTVIISMDENTVYLFNDELQLINKLETIDYNKAIPVRVWWAAVSWVCSIILIVVFIAWIVEGS